MNRLTKTAASAMLLMFMSATPAWAMATNGPVSTPTDPAIIRTLAAPTGQPVLISAPASEEVYEVLATRAEPVSILFQNNRITYDQKPLVVDGTLMVPLRAIVEGAGGEVGWDGGTKTVTVRLEDRRAVFVIGASEAEMNEDGTSSMLVGGAPMANGEGSLTWFAVTDTTQITLAENGVQRQGSVADLAAALRVEVRPVGPLLMSYPARGGAASIVIHK